MKTVVGEIVKPQGIRGEIKIKPLVDDANYFNDLSVFFVENNKFTKKSCRVHQGFVYLSLNEIKDRDTAETLRNKFIEVEKDDLPKLKDGQYYITDLENCEIFFEDGEEVGKVVAVENYGASDILQIQVGTEEILCPFLEDVFVDVDIVNKKITVNKKRFLEVTQSED